MSTNEQREKVEAWLKEQTDLPPSVPKNTLPSFTNHPRTFYILERILPWLSFPTVRVHQVGERLFRLEWRQFGVCTHKAHLTTYAIYKVAFMLFALTRVGQTNKGAMFADDDGFVYVPRWSIAPLLKELEQVCRENHTYIMSIDEQYQKLSKEIESEHVPTTSEIIKEGKDETPTLH